MPAPIPIDDSVIARLFVLLHTRPEAGDLAEALSMDDAQWSAVLALAAGQHVSAYLYWNLQRLQALAALPPGYLARLHAGYLSNAARNRVLLSGLQPVLDAFAEHGIPTIVLKGTYLVDQVYGSMGARAVGDADLLLPAARIGEAIAILETLGYVGSGPFDPALLTAHKHLPPYRRNGHFLELHHSLLCMECPLPIDVAELWQRAVPDTVAGRSVFVLSPEDQLLHLCVHGALEHQMNLDIRFLLDIVTYSAYAAQRLDWNIVVARAHRLGWTRSVWLALDLACSLLGAHVPAGVVRQLLPSDVDPRIRRMAITQLFDSRISVNTDMREFSKLWAQNGTRARKLQHLWNRVFLPRAMMAHQYHVAPDSPRLPLYYAIRVRDLVFGYLPRARAMLSGDDSTKDLVSRTGEFDRWLTTREASSGAGQYSAEDR